MALLSLCVLPVPESTSQLPDLVNVSQGCFALSPRAFADVSSCKGSSGLHLASHSRILPDLFSCPPV